MPDASSDRRTSIHVKPGTYDLTPPWFLHLRQKLTRHRHRRSAKMPDYGTRTIGGRNVRHVASLGTHCLASGILKNADLKRYSLPFDWGWATPAMVLHCLQTDFQDFLPEQAEEDHVLYRRLFGIACVFAHRDIREPLNRAYYERCMNRMRRLFASDEAKLFLMIARPETPIGAHFEEIVDQLGRTTSRAELLAIQLQPPRGNGQSLSLELVGEHKGSRLYNFRPASKEAGLGYFPDIVDELVVLRLVYEYAIDLKSAP
ncbi:papain-like cysteine peptidase [Asaia krungthepensis]|uniref:papain-like cysteine peptidase n=1 Tax=Asaia krungthepensis TaxID=220990 RepID=UPI00223095B3|nr:papain-like cysteine peptidase [Asaia krungthepensis]